MTPERVNEMLKNYREYSGRCAYLETYIKQLEKEVENMQDNLVLDQIASGGGSLDGMPHGTTVGNPTERAGIALADGYMPDYLLLKKKELADAQLEVSRKATTVIFVNAWLRGLSERERWIIENQVIDGVSWRELTTEYYIKFGETRTKRALQLFRGKAMEKIYRMAE